MPTIKSLDTKSLRYEHFQNCQLKNTTKLEKSSNRYAFLKRLS